MKLIESKVEYLPQENGIEGIYKMIELAGRTAYHSQDKITSDSAKDFVDRMIKSNHGAALEHGTVYLSFELATYNRLGREVISKYVKNKYSKVVYVSNSVYHRGPSYKLFDVMQDDIRGDRTYYITTNYRILIENNWLDDLQYLCSPTEFHEKRYTMRFTCSRAIAQELTRHRVFSFLMESQRYINYSKERHGGEIPIIIPSWSSGLIEGNTYDMTIAKMCGISEGIKPLEQGFLWQCALQKRCILSFWKMDVLLSKQEMFFLMLLRQNL